MVNQDDISFIAEPDARPHEPGTGKGYLTNWASA